jgi:hypothetical protein
MCAAFDNKTVYTTSDKILQELLDTGFYGSDEESTTLKRADNILNDINDILDEFRNTEIPNKYQSNIINGFIEIRMLIVNFILDKIVKIVQTIIAKDIKLILNSKLYDPIIYILNTITQYYQGLSDWDYSLADKTINIEKDLSDILTPSPKKNKKIVLKFTEKEKPLIAPRRSTKKNKWKIDEVDINRGSLKYIVHEIDAKPENAIVYVYNTIGEAQTTLDRLNQNFAETDEDRAATDRAIDEIIKIEGVWSL